MIGGLPQDMKTSIRFAIHSGCNFRTGSLAETSTTSKAGPQQAAQLKQSNEGSKYMQDAHSRLF